MTSTFLIVFHIIKVINRENNYELLICCFMLDYHGGIINEEAPLSEETEETKEPKAEEETKEEEENLGDDH